MISLPFYPSHFLSCTSDIISSNCLLIFFSSSWYYFLYLSTLEWQSPSTWETNWFPWTAKTIVLSTFFLRFWFLRLGNRSGNNVIKPIFSFISGNLLFVDSILSFWIEKSSILFIGALNLVLTSLKNVSHSSFSFSICFSINFDNL